MQESLAAGVRQLVLPFSTDQFANAFDLERTGLGAVASPNTSSAVGLAGLAEEILSGAAPAPILGADTVDLAAALTDPKAIPA